MNNLSQKRFMFLDEMLGEDFYTIDTYHAKDFTEFVVSRGGDVLTYRVYGTERDDFRITER